MELQGVTWRLILVLIAVALGTNFMLYSNSVINNLLTIAQPWVNQSFIEHYDSVLTSNQFHWLWSLSTAALHFGALFGSLFTSVLAESQFFGRRRGLMLVSLVTILGGILNGVAKSANSFEVFAAGRFVLGLALGSGTGLGSIFVAELAPAKYRGACGSVQQMFLGFGNLLSQVLTLPELLGTDALWPIAVAFPLVPGLILLGTLFFSPESPRYLFLTRDNQTESRRSIEFYQGSDRVRVVFTDLQNEMESLASSGQQIGFLGLFSRRQTLIPLLLSLLINFGVQMSGIGAVMAYSENMFTDAGLETKTAKHATVGIGLCNFLSPFLTMLIVDKKGRRPLLFIGYFISLLCLSLLSLFVQGHRYWGWSKWAAYSTMGYLYIFQIGFAISSSISWIAPPELFPQNARASALTVVIFSRWFLQCLTVLLYLPFRDLVGVPLSFVPFIVCIVIAGVLLWKFLPETKSRTFREISQYFGYMPLQDDSESNSETEHIAHGQPQNYGSMNDAGGLLE